jgi:hypothetical protein
MLLVAGVDGVLEVCANDGRMVIQSNPDANTFQ